MVYAGIGHSLAWWIMAFGFNFLWAVIDSWKKKLGFAIAIIGITAVVVMALYGIGTGQDLSITEPWYHWAGLLAAAFLGSYSGRFTYKEVFR